MIYFLTMAICILTFACFISILRTDMITFVFHNAQANKWCFKHKNISRSRNILSCHLYTPLPTQMPHYIEGIVSHDLHKFTRHTRQRDRLLSWHRLYLWTTHPLYSKHKMLRAPIRLVGDLVNVSHSQPPIPSSTITRIPFRAIAMPMVDICLCSLRFYQRKC